MDYVLFLNTCRSELSGCYSEGVFQDLKVDNQKKSQCQLGWKVATKICLFVSKAKCLRLKNRINIKEEQLFSSWCNRNGMRKRTEYLKTSCFLNVPLCLSSFLIFFLITFTGFMEHFSMFYYSYEPTEVSFNIFLQLCATQNSTCNIVFYLFILNCFYPYIGKEQS